MRRHEQCKLKNLTCVCSVGRGLESNCNSPEVATGKRLVRAATTLASESCSGRTTGYRGKGTATGGSGGLRGATEREV